MRILVFNEAPVALLGGIMTETRMLIAGLQARGHSVALASDAPLSGVEAEHYAVSAPRSSQSLEQFHEALVAFRPDIVHVLFAFVGGVLNYSKILKGRSWVLTCHSVPPREWSAGMLHRSDWLHYLVRAWRIRRPTIGGALIYGWRIPPHIIVHSETICRHLRLWLYPRSRITIIPFGYQPAVAGHIWPELRKIDSAPRLLTIAGITHTKGHHDVLTALPLVCKKYPALKYVILGEVRDPSYFSFLKSRISELDLEKNVEFVISASKKQVEESLARADLFIQPSHEEGFCLSYMEGAAQVPRIVGTKTGALPEMSAGDPGARIVPVRRPKALAEAVLTLLGVKLVPGHMQRRDRRLAATFSWSKYFETHESVYEAAVRKGALAR